MASQVPDQHLINLCRIYPPAYPMIMKLLKANRNLRDKNCELKDSWNQVQQELRNQICNNHKLRHDLWEATHNQTMQKLAVIQKEEGDGNTEIDEPLDLSIRKRRFSSTLLEPNKAVYNSDQNRVQCIPCQVQGSVEVSHQHRPAFAPSTLPIKKRAIVMENNMNVPPHPCN